jgi:hypothetical protein
MADQRSKEMVGTWVRGADGALYFIPEDKMEAFRVPGEVVEGALKGLREHERGEEMVIEPLPALRGPFALKDLKVSGPLALKDLMSGPAAIIPPAATLRGLRGIK